MQDFIAGHLRQLFQVAVDHRRAHHVTAAVAGPQYTRAAGSFLTDGFRVGSLVNWTGWTAPATGNNNRYFIITALTALQMTGIFLDGTPVVAKAAGDNVTCTLVRQEDVDPAGRPHERIFRLRGIPARHDGHSERALGEHVHQHRSSRSTRRATWASTTTCWAQAAEHDRRSRISRRPRRSRRTACTTCSTARST
jgi:hypothetical protein